MRFSYFIITLFLCFGGSKSQDLKESVRNILKDDEFKEDVKKVILHLLENDENLKREVIEIFKDDIKEDIKSKFFYLLHIDLESITF